MIKTVKIEGMSCMHCVKAVTEELSGITGVTSVNVSLENKSAVVEIADESVTDNTLRDAVEEAGYDVIEII